LPSAHPPLVLRRECRRASRVTVGRGRYGGDLHRTHVSTVRFQHGDGVAGQRELLTRPRNPVQGGQHPTGPRLVVLLGQGPIQRLVQLVDVGGGAHPVAAVGQSLHGGGGAIVLVVDLAHDLLEVVLQRPPPRPPAVLVDDHGQVVARALHL